MEPNFCAVLEPKLIDLQPQKNQSPRIVERVLNRDNDYMPIKQVLPKKYNLFCYIFFR